MLATGGCLDVSAARGVTPKTNGKAVFQRSLRDVREIPLERLIVHEGYWDKVKDNTKSSNLYLADRKKSFKRSIDKKHDAGYYGCMAHRIVLGDNLSKISKAYYGDSRHCAAIARFNKLDRGAIDIESLLYLPMGPLSGRLPKRLPDYYIVAPGDTLYRIARKICGDGNKCKQILADINGKKPDARTLVAGMILKTCK